MVQKHKIKGKKAIIGVKNSYSAEWLSKKHNDMIQETISYVYDKELKPEFKVDKSLVNEEIPQVTKQEKTREENESLFNVQNGQNISHTEAINNSGLNPTYTFSSFVVGESNRLAHAAAVGVGNSPGNAYNPLFIYGKTGLGKTHLAQAVGRSILDKDPSKKITYVSSETFMNEMIKAIQNSKNVDFRQRFRTVDALIIDDIQLISKRSKTQEEFFNTFNVLYNSKKQIVLTSDLPPNKLQDIDDRIISRFQGGMVVEVYKPDFETRLAIITKKTKSMGISISDRVLDYLAKEITDNIRELEGALQKISLYGSMVDNKLSIKEIEKIIGRDPQSKRQRIKVSDVLKRVGKEFDVTMKDLKSRKRHANIAFARQVCMFILREEFKYKLEKTASFLKRKDHTTVIHAVDKVKSKMEVNEGFKDQLNLILDDLK
jgi:chromosomal replication initiator protein